MLWYLYQHTKQVITLRLSRAAPSLLKNLKYTLWLPPYLLFFVLLEQRPLPHYWATQIPLDDLIPFCEWFAVPYCLWFPLLIGMGLYLFFRNSAAFRRYMLFLAVTFLLSELIWLLVPNGQDLRPPLPLPDNFAARIMEALYSIDTHTNVFPSVHVVGSAGAALAAWDALHEKKGLCIALTLLAVLICLSIVFVKQHGVLDLLGGLVLAALAAVPIYRKHT